VFYHCPAEWLYKRVFYLTNLDLEAKLLDDTSLGLLYHRILKDLFSRIRAEDGVFRAERLETYGSWIRDITEADAQSHPAFQGPLAVPLVVSQAKAITQRLTGLLETEARYFSGYTVADLESALNMVHADCYLNGVLDRVSVDPNDAPVIVDYKTGATPTKKASSNTEDAPLEDFQMPMYIRLYEEKNNVTVEGAYFISINKQDITAVIGSPGRKKGFSREEYQPTLDAFDFYIEHFRDSVETLNFVPPEINFTACLGCDYRTICRTTYALNSQGFSVQLPPEGNHGR
jgi:ATP-dependent helicase/DNAse subunit B